MPSYEQILEDVLDQRVEDLANERNDLRSQRTGVKNWELEDRISEITAELRPILEKANKEFLEMTKDPVLYDRFLRDLNYLETGDPYYLDRPIPVTIKGTGGYIPGPEGIPTAADISELPDYGGRGPFHYPSPEQRPPPKPTYEYEGPGRKKELMTYYENLANIMEQAEATEPFVDIAEEGLPRRGPSTSKRGKAIVKQYGKGKWVHGPSHRSKPKTAGMDYKRGHRPRKKEFVQAIANAVYGGDTTKVRSHDIKHFTRSWEEDLLGGLSTEDLKTILKNAAAYDDKNIAALLGLDDVKEAKQTLKQFAVEIELRKAQARGAASRKATKEKFSTTGKEKALEDITSELRTEKTRVEAALRRSEADAKTAATPAARTAAEGLIVAARKRIKELNQNIKAAKKPKGIKGKGGLIGLLGYLVWRASQDEAASGDTQQASVDVIALLNAMTNGEWDKWNAAYANPHTPASEKQTLKAYMTHALQDLSEGMQDLLPPKNPFGGEITEVAAQDMIKRVDEAAQVMLTAEERAPLAGMERTEGHPFTPTKGLSKLEAALEKIAPTTPAQPPTWFDDWAEGIGRYPYLGSERYPIKKDPWGRQPYTPPVISDPVPPGRHTFYTPEEIDLMRGIGIIDADHEERMRAKELVTGAGQPSKEWQGYAEYDMLEGAKKDIPSDPVEPRLLPEGIGPPPDLQDPAAMRIWDSLTRAEQADVWRVYNAENPPGIARPGQGLVEQYGEGYRRQRPGPRLVLDPEAVAIGEADYAAELQRRVNARNVLGVPDPEPPGGPLATVEPIRIPPPLESFAARGALRPPPPSNLLHGADILRTQGYPQQAKALERLIRQSPNRAAQLNKTLTKQNLGRAAGAAVLPLIGMGLVDIFTDDDIPWYDDDPRAYTKDNALADYIAAIATYGGTAGIQLARDTKERMAAGEAIDQPRWIRRLANLPEVLGSVLGYETPGAYTWAEPEQSLQDELESDTARAAQLVREQTGEEPTQFFGKGRRGAGTDVPRREPITFDQPSVFEQLGLLEQDPPEVSYGQVAEILEEPATSFAEKGTIVGDLPMDWEEWRKGSWVPGAIKEQTQVPLVGRKAPEPMTDPIGAREAAVRKALSTLGPLPKPGSKVD